MKRLLTYFGLSGKAPPHPWWWGIFESVPPLAVGCVIAVIDGVDGWGGYGLWVLYMSLGWAVWLPIVMRLARRRVSGG